MPSLRSAPQLPGGPGGAAGVSGGQQGAGGRAGSPAEPGGASHEGPAVWEPKTQEWGREPQGNCGKTRRDDPCLTVHDSWGSFPLFSFTFVLWFFLKLEAKTARSVLFLYSEESFKKRIQIQIIFYGPRYCGDLRCVTFFQSGNVLWFFELQV